MSILFLDDWRYHPTAIVDEKTSNHTFLRQAELYKKMGVENYFFHLALLNPNLQGIDPFDLRLPPDIKQAIAIECVENPWYFFRELSRVKPAAGLKGKPLLANRGNIALFWLFLNHIDVGLMQPRQTGKSVSTDCLMIYLLFIAALGTDITLVTKDNNLRIKNVRRLKEMRDYLPEYIYKFHPADGNNLEFIKCSKNKSMYSTAVAQNDVASANNLGRGVTTPIVHFDEPPFTKYIHVTMSALLPATTAAKQDAMAAGLPYGNIFTTTAGKKDTKEGAYIHKLFTGGVEWTEFLFDCKNEQELHNRVDKLSKEKPMVTITLNHRQLGYTDEWLFKTMRENVSYGEDADRDYFNRWTSGGLSSPLTTELNELLRSSQTAPLHVELSDYETTLFWYIPRDHVEEYMRNNNTVLGMDWSECVGRDNTTLILRDVSTGAVVMTSAFNEVNIQRAMEYIVKLIQRYPKMTIIPERKNTGVVLIDMLLLKLPALGIDPFRRIYNTIVDNDLMNEDRYAYAKADLARRPDWFYDKVKNCFGFTTTGSGQHSRSSLYRDTLTRAVTVSGAVAKDKQLIDELTGLVIKNGRLDHGSGGNDDCVVAWLLSFWMLTMSKNLSHYGIHDPLKNAKEWTASPTPEPKNAAEAHQLKEQAKYRDEFSKLSVLLKECKVDIVAKQIEAKLRLLECKIIDHGEGIKTVDSLIAEASELRRKAILERRALYNNHMSYR